MSDELVNKLTLNFLISKKQLHRLNHKFKETSNQRKIRELNEYSERIKQLFNDLLVSQPPEDCLLDVRHAFETFTEKAIYYFKAHDDTNKLEIERSTNQDIQDDIDYDREEKEIEKGNYEEISEHEENEDEKNEDEENEDEEDKTETNQETNHDPHIQHPIIVTGKYKHTSKYNVVDDLQKLPLNWFENVRQNYKKNQIIPRTKDTTITETNFRDIKKKI